MSERMTLRKSERTGSNLPNHWKLHKSHEILGNYIDHKKNLVNKKKKILKFFLHIGGISTVNTVWHGLKILRRGSSSMTQM